MIQLNSLLLAVESSLAIALFVVLPLVGLAIGGVVAWLILKKVSKKNSEKKLDDTSKLVENMLANAEETSSTGR